MSRSEEYDWLDDPFDERKAVAERDRARMGGGSRAAVALGCLVALVLVVLLFALSGWAILGA